MNNHTNQTDNDDCPTCYGDSEKHGQIDACSSCEYFDSCRWYIDNPDPCADGKRFSRGHDVSFEAVQFSEQVANIPAPDSDDDSESRQTNGKTVFTLDELRRLLEFMLRDIDDYSLAIVECALRTDCTSAADLARAFDVSREAIHRKLIDCCAKNPQIGYLLRAVLYKCAILGDPEIRSRISGRRTKPDQIQNNNDQNQMEFNF